MTNHRKQPLAGAGFPGSRTAIERAAARDIAANIWHRVNTRDDMDEATARKKLTPPSLKNDPLRFHAGRK